MNVGQEVDFYEIPVLNSAEYRLLNALTHLESRKGIQDIVDEYMAVFKAPTEIMRRPDLSESEKSRLCKEASLMGHEKLNTQIEERSADVLSHILDFDAGFLKNDINRFNAMLFLNYQSFRTKKSRVQLRTAPLPPMHEHFKGADMKKLIGAMSVFIALQASVGLHGWSDRYDIKILKNITEVNFITGDQPVVNMEPIVEGNPKVCLYCPVGPRVSILLTMGLTEPIVEIISDSAVIKTWNKVVFEHAHEQRYAISEGDLRVL